MSATRSYLVYEGPGDLRVEMGEVAAVPAEGSLVRIDGKSFVAVDVTWDVFTLEGSIAFALADLPPSEFPQQCATVTLERKRRRRSR